MDADSSEDDFCFTTVWQLKKKCLVAHLARKGSEGCAFLRFRRLRP